MNDKAFYGKSILVVEDEYYVATELRDGFAAAGATVIGPAPSLETAFDLIGNATIDAAVLDINLGGEMVFPVADHLLKREIPVVFSTGYDRSAIPQRFTGVPRCEKPSGFAKVSEALAEALTRKSKDGC